MSQKDSKTGAADSVLGFYGVELQSHAALAVGAFIGFFGVLQLAIAERPPPQKFVIVLPIVMALLIFVVIYSVMRLVVYGGLANAILSENMEGCVSQKEVSEKASEFYLRHYKNWWRRLIYGGQKPKGWVPKGRLWRVWWFGYHQPRPIVMFAILIVSGIVSYWLIT